MERTVQQYQKSHHRLMGAGPEGLADGIQQHGQHVDAERREEIEESE